MLRRRIPQLLAPLLVLGCGNDSSTPVAPVASDVEHCRNQLAQIYNGLLEYAQTHGGAPNGSGVAFFGSLIAEGIWPNDGEHAALLQCPGATQRLPEGAPEAWFGDLSAVQELNSSYAGRDQAQFPLTRFPTRGDEVLIACDNHGGANHTEGLNALFADGSVVTYITEEERSNGNLPDDLSAIPIGPDSPIEELRKLVAQP